MKPPSVLVLFYPLGVTSVTFFLDPMPETLAEPLPFARPKSMQVQVNLDRDDPVYTNRDSISGKIIITKRNSWLNLSLTSVSLLGIAVSRSGANLETHLVRIWFNPSYIERSSKNLQLLQKTKSFSLLLCLIAQLLTWDPPLAKESTLSRSLSRHAS
jgi:hypothetical protein